MTTSSNAMVFIVDDDVAVRDSLSLLAKSVGLTASTYESGTEFLESPGPDQPGCLVLDIRMPGISGLEVQKRLVERGSLLPIIFITGHADVPIAVSAMKAGAADFIQKPFRDQDLLDKIQEALKENAALRGRVHDTEAVKARAARLTPREQEVMDMVVEGLPNKAIAYDLSLSERTVEIHRARVMKKMEAGSLAELVQMVVRTRS